MAIRHLEIPLIVTPEQIERTISKLPNGKAPGPDGIPNEVLKVISSDIAKDLAQAITQQFRDGTVPDSFRETTTVALRKERREGLLHSEQLQTNSFGEFHG